MRKSLSLLSLLLVATACNAGNKAATDSTSMASGDSMKAAMPADDNAAKDAVGKVRTAWKDGADKKDSSAVAALYTDDAVLVGTDIPVASGRPEIQTRLGQMFAVASTTTIDSKETVVSGDLAYDYGTFNQTVTPPTAKPMKQDGYYLATLRKGADGSWKISRHVSMTLPAKP
ncbi:MAG TPA: SgcJ/EcaC family oxidoreductase [Gemmatimonadaceae bacterium]|nr:SgcJ/EcaC family oxidoreductase [Gemmatimonadaceae bacterium]